MLEGTHVTVRLHSVKQAPFTISGIYRGSIQRHERGTPYLIVEGTVGDYIGKLIHIPETLIHVIVMEG